MAGGGAGRAVTGGGLTGATGPAGNPNGNGILAGGFGAFGFSTLSTVLHFGQRTISAPSGSRSIDWHVGQVTIIDMHILRFAIGKSVNLS